MLVLAPALAAQPTGDESATLAGIVREAGTGEVLPGASVLLTSLDAPNATPRGRAATAEGGFIFTDVAPGRYTLRASFTGHVTRTDTLALEPGAEIEYVIELRPREIGDVLVEAGSDREPIQAGRVALRPAEIANLPGPDPGGDLLQAITFQPGVVALGDRGGQLTVRGGTPVQNLVLVDGIPLFQPFHIVGFYSAIPADVVSQADIYAGGYPARYGGRISSVVDVTTRNGSKQRFAARATAAPFLAGLQLEGPIVPGAVSAVVSVRESVVEDVGQAVGRDFPYRFGDALAKVHAQLDGTTFLTATALRTSDRGALAAGPNGEAGVRWSNEGAAGRFFSISPHFAAALDIGVFATRYTAEFEPTRGATRASTASAYGGNFGYVYYLGPHTVRAGFGGQTFLFDYAFDTFEGSTRENTTEGHFFVDADIAIGPRITLEPGIRIQGFPSQTRNPSVEPRGRATWEITDDHAVSLAGGLYRQEIIGLADQLDVGDGFIAWAPTIDGRGIPRAVHGIAGWDGRFGRTFGLGVEVYGKQLYNQVLLLTDPEPARVDGEVIGLDMRADWRLGPLSLDAVYGLSRTVYRDTYRQGNRASTEGEAPDAYNPPHDRTHRGRLVARVDAAGWSLGARAELASGRPYSRVVGAFLDVGGRRPSDTRTEEGQPAVVLTDTPYDTRTPAYFRLDLSAERRFDLGAAGLVVQGSLINATDRANLYTFDLFQGERVDQFRVIPSVGIRVEVE